MQHFSRVFFLKYPHRECEVGIYERPRSTQLYNLVINYILVDYILKPGAS